MSEVKFVYIEKADEFYGRPVSGDVVDIALFVLDELSPLEYGKLTKPPKVENGRYRVYSHKGMFTLDVETHAMSIRPLEELLGILGAKVMEVGEGIKVYERDGVVLVTDGANGVLIIPYANDVYQVYIIA